MLWREKFRRPAPPARYFLSHSIGLQPVSARAFFEDAFLDDWLAGSAATWEGWLESISEFRAQLAALIGADPRDVCPQTNISSALTKIIYALPRGKHRHRIVLSRDDFPTIGFVAAQAKQMGFTIEYIDGGTALADPDHWSTALREDVFLVHLTHVYSNSGLKTPVAEISKRVKAVGAWCVVDTAQSVGAIPIDVSEWSADFVTGTSIKYLCGGPGAAWLWARPETSAISTPIDVGWFSHAAPFQFDIDNFEYASGAARFLGGTPSVAPYAFATAGIDTIRTIGVKNLSTHVTGLINKLVENLPPIAVMSHTKRDEHGAHFVLRVEELARASAKLLEQGILHDIRDGGLRFSCHCYTDEEDALALLKAINAFLPR